MFNCFQDTSTLGKFDDPFLLPSSDYIPDSLSSALDFCRYLYGLNPEYRKASQRVVRHFVQDFLIKGGSPEEQADLKDYLTYTLKLPHAMMEMGDEWSAYGNGFFRVQRPFKRFLVHKTREGKTVYFSLEQFNLTDLEFDRTTKRYKVPDPTQNFKAKVSMDFLDLEENDKDNVRLRKLDPRYIDIISSTVTGDKLFVYRFPQKLKNDVKAGNIFQINHTPRQMLLALLDDKDFLFNEDEVFHFKAPTISGVSENDWGLPEPIANFRLLYQIQVYRKMDEALGLDYMMPFRVITPEFDSNESPATQSIAMNRWRPEIQKLIDNRRKNKFSMASLPFPVKYEEFGANGKQLTSKDLLEYQINNLLNAVGYPAEMYTMSLELKQMPTAIRLFENSFWFIHENFVNFTKWVIDKLRTKFLKLDDTVEVSVERPSMASDIDQQNVLLQLGMQGELPRELYMKHWGVDDPVEAKVRRIRQDLDLERQEYIAREEAKRELEAADSLRQHGPESAQGGEGTTPMDVEEKAMQLAQEWLSMPEGERSKAMQVTKHQNLNLYSMAKEFMEQFRRQGASEGRQMVNEQAQQGG